MKHLKNLIKATIEDSKSNWAISEDTVSYTHLTLPTRS